MEYNIRVYKPELKQEEGKINNLKGFATITFDEAFCVKSLAIKESSKGNLYLDMPRYRDYETGEYSNAIVHAFQGFRAPFSGKIVHIFPEQSAAFN